MFAPELLSRLKTTIGGMGWAGEDWWAGLQCVENAGKIE
jgi:hypothetical protein